MNKIIELLIDWEGLDFGETGATIMSLVDRPAIGLSWQAFAAQQFVDRLPGETKEDYVSRCIPVLIGEGYDQDQAAAICYDSFGVDTGNLQPYTDETGDLEKKILDLMASEEFGEYINTDDAVYIDMTKTGFNTITDYLKGIIGLDILGKRDVKEMSPETKYRYAGPPAERNFCKAMLRLNKFYTYAEIQEMESRVNTGFRHNNQPYSIWKYKGGKYCKHYWEAVSLFKNTNGQTVIVSHGPADGNAGQAATASNDYWAYPGTFNMQFAADDEKRIVTGPAMIPFMMIPRRDELGNIFHVYFSDETIKKIAQKFLQEKHLHNTDINHNNVVVEDNTLLESWIVEDPEKDKAAVMGYDVPKGTWMVSYKINDDATWQQIKSGALTGFSIAGDFLEKKQ